MSGGSFQYLYSRDSDFLFSRTDLIENMRDRLLRLGYIDAAGQTDALLNTIIQAQKLIEMRRVALADVWQAVEWLVSGDWGEEQVAAAIEKYREGK